MRTSVSNSTILISPEVSHHLLDGLFCWVHIEEGMIRYPSGAPGDFRFNDPFHFAAIQDGHFLVSVDGFKSHSSGNAGLRLMLS